MAQATNMGIFLMLGVVVLVLGSFASFFLYLARRARIATNDEVVEQGAVVSAPSARAAV
jgi:hypothetical protein